MSDNTYADERRRHLALARATEQAHKGGTMPPKSADAIRFHLDEADRLDAMIAAKANGRAYLDDVGDAMRLDDLDYPSHGQTPGHAVKTISHKESIGAALGVRKPDEEAAYGFLGTMLKNAVEPQSPDTFDKWARAAGVSTKDMGTGGAGAQLIPTPIAGFLVDLLRARTVVSALGATTVPMTTSTLKINRQTGDVTASWYSEAATLTTSDATLDTITLTARALQAGTKISLELAEDSSDPVDAGRIVATSIAAAMALELDRVALRGTGTPPQPTGVKNASGVGTLALGTNGAAFTFDSALSMSSTLAQANVTNRGYVFHPRTWYALAGSKDSQQRYLNPPDAIRDAYAASQATTALPTNLVKGTSGAVCTEAYAGDWSALMIGMRLNLTLQTLTELYRGSGQIGIVGRLRADVGVRHGASFVVCADATN